MRAITTHILCTALPHHTYRPVDSQRSVFLPTGNPDTGFRYGVVHKGSCLRLCPTKARHPTPVCLPTSSTPLPLPRHSSTPLHVASQEFWERVYLIHLSVYSRASLAFHWVTLEDGTTEHITPPFTQDGVYLVRVILKQATCKQVQM